MYAIETRLASKSGWFTPAESNAHYATKYARTGITIHWWNSPDKAGTHDQTANYVLGQAAQGNMSCNYVVSDSKITLLVDPINVAWHAGPKANPITIGIECDPRLGAEGYRKLGWLVHELEKRFNRSLALHPHNSFVATACPGNLDLNRIRNEANQFKAGPAPAPQPAKTGDTIMNPTEENEAYQIVLERPMEHGGSGRTGITFIRGARAELDQKRAALKNQLNSLQTSNNDLSAKVQATQAERDAARKQVETYVAAIDKLKVELEAANNKPAHEVIKEVEKIVEKCSAPAEPEVVKPDWLAKLMHKLFGRFIKA